MKLTIVINGAGGVGKDTLCNFAAEKYSVMNISAIDPIKVAAKLLGWNETKDMASRKFLSDLKNLSSNYNDWPTKYLIRKFDYFKISSFEILFVHIREGAEIQHFINSIEGNIVTLLIRRKRDQVVYGNSSDDDVEKYNYDYIYNNDLPLEKAKEDFLLYLDYIVSNAK